MEGYSVKILEVSKELTAKERIQFKDVSDAAPLDREVSENDTVVITPAFYGVLAVHNEHAKDGNNKDYEVYVIVDEDGTKYTTGSQSFWSAFTNIVDEMKDSDEIYAVKVYTIESKNRSGKHFITCSII